jgi:NADPH-dependent 2,4-dienoyl-CoA reductase/sulfur reductase-like enzyme
LAAESLTASNKCGWEDIMAKFDLNDDGVVVIVGSGAGGGTLGNELAQKGVKVVILEAGPRIELQDFINNIRQLAGPQGFCEPAGVDRQIGRRIDRPLGGRVPAVRRA